MKTVCLCRECAKKFKPKEDVRMKRAMSKAGCLFSNPFISSYEVSELIEVIA